MGKRLYLVAFDLRGGGDYACLKTRLAGPMLGQQVLENVWAFRSAESAAQVKEMLRGFIEDADRILVVEVGRDCASRRALFPLAELIERVGGPAQKLWRQKRGDERH